MVEVLEFETTDPALQGEMTSHHCTDGSGRGHRRRSSCTRACPMACPATTTTPARAWRWRTWPGSSSRATPSSTTDPFDLARFVSAQDADGTYGRAVAELRAGRKRTHWMWFVFPQIAGTRAQQHRTAVRHQLTRRSRRLPAAPRAGTPVARVHGHCGRDARADGGGDLRAGRRHEAPFLHDAVHAGRPGRALVSPRPGALTSPGFPTRPPTACSERRPERKTAVSAVLR